MVAMRSCTSGAMRYKRARAVRRCYESCTKETVKMKLSIIGLSCIAALRINASPLGAAMAVGSASFRPSTSQSGPFAEGFRDWLKSVKNRLIGATDSHAQPPQEAANMIMQLENENPQERRRNNPQGFFLDLTNLTFNPDRDWGFRLGQWYFIRKPNDDLPSVDWNSSNYPEWPTMDDGTDYEMSPPLGTIKPIDEITTVAAAAAALTPAKEAPTAMEPEPMDFDNENENDPKSIQSAEVLIPSE